MSGNQAKIAVIKIDIDEMRKLVDVANRRVSALIRFGLDGLEDRDGGDLCLNASLYYQFWPSDVSSEHRIAAREEYRSWLVGSCLRELDLFYGLFLDRVWFALEATELHESNVGSAPVFDQKFARNTNVAKKQQMVSEKLGIEDHYEELNSLSLARNALTHHAGQVRSPVDCNSDTRDRLIVKWLGFDMIVSRGGEERVVEQGPFDTNELPGDGASQISVRFTTRSFEVASGQKLVFTHVQIAELCMFYKTMSDKTINALLDLCRAQGLIPASSSEMASG